MVLGTRPDSRLTRLPNAKPCDEQRQRCESQGSSRRDRGCQFAAHDWLHLPRDKRMGRWSMPRWQTPVLASRWHRMCECAFLGSGQTAESDSAPSGFWPFLPLTPRHRRIQVPSAVRGAARGDPLSIPLQIAQLLRYQCLSLAGECGACFCRPSIPESLHPPISSPPCEPTCLGHPAPPLPWPSDSRPRYGLSVPSGPSG